MADHSASHMKSAHASWLIGSALLATAVACTDDGAVMAEVESEAGPGGDAAPPAGTDASAAGTDAPSTAPYDPNGTWEEAGLPPIPCVPTFASIQATIFTPSCSFPMCHSAIGATYGFYLGGPDVLQSLIDYPAVCRGWTRVVPGSPEESFLWRKVVDDDPACGYRMPWGLPRLPDNAIECIRAWIAGL